MTKKKKVIDDYKISPTADKPNMNGITYPYDTLREAINEFNKITPVLCTVRPEYPCDATEISHQVLNLSMDEEGTITARIQLFKTPRGRALHKMINGLDDLMYAGLYSIGVLHDQTVQTLFIKGVSFHVLPPLDQETE